MYFSDLRNAISALSTGQKIERGCQKWQEKGFMESYHAISETL
jgi:hypothetical protein